MTYSPMQTNKGSRLKKFIAFYWTFGAYEFIEKWKLGYVIHNEWQNWWFTFKYLNIIDVQLLDIIH